MAGKKKTKATAAPKAKSTIKKKAKAAPVSKVKSIVKKKAKKVLVKAKSVTKKSVKAAPASKAKKVVKKKPVATAVKKKTAGKRIVIGKNVVVTKKKVVAVKKAAAKKAAVKPKGKKVVVKAYKKPSIPVVKNLPLSTYLPHGVDLHLIPVTGEIHIARLDDKKQIEKNYEHTEETALHMEQQKAKQIMAMTRNGAGKRIYKNR